MTKDQIAALLLRADTYLADNGWGSPASEIIWDMAKFIRSQIEREN